VAEDVDVAEVLDGDVAEVLDGDVDVAVEDVDVGLVGEAKLKMEIHGQKMSRTLKTLILKQNFTSSLDLIEPHHLPRHR